MKGTSTRRWQRKLQQQRTCINIISTTPHYGKAPRYARRMTRPQSLGELVIWAIRMAAFEPRVIPMSPDRENKVLLYQAQERPSSSK